ncbi:MAG TPA: HNH endonuclease [Thermomicrobiales bacterium]|jgi:putative restriction endonuclease|nr:HNH endonuclease [Thermomicrobiales bacterium]
MSLPPLVRKAVGDAGFDLRLGADNEWVRFGVSGSEHVVWLLPSGAGAAFAVAARPLLQEFTPLAWAEVPLPPGAVGAVRCRSAQDLYLALRRLRVLLDQLPPAPQQRFAQRLAAVARTEAEALVRQRVGQDLFREMLMEYWGGRCALTGLDVPELLRASHAKPWKDCNDRERLDVYNGLLLAVHLDVLFDRGFLTFDEGGSAVFSAQLSDHARRLLLGEDLQTGAVRLVAGHQPYMAYHRQHVFRDARDALDSESRILRGDTQA